MKDLETKLCRHKQNEVVLVHYIKFYVKGGGGGGGGGVKDMEFSGGMLKNDFVYVET